MHQNIRPLLAIALLLAIGCAVTTFILNEIDNIDPLTHIQTMTTKEALVSENQEYVSQVTLNEIKYREEEGRLTDGEKTVYVFPPTLLHELKKTHPDWPSEIFGAVPVPGTPDKYFVSTSTMTNDRTDPVACGSSNKIYILDTLSNQATLLYEENDKTIPASDAVKGCNKDMSLIATQGAQLIFKYHTWETGGMCDQAWADPERTYFLDTLNVTQGTQKFPIPNELYMRALDKVKECQATL